MARDREGNCTDNIKVAETSEVVQTVRVWLTCVECQSKMICVGRGTDSYKHRCKTCGRSEYYRECYPCIRHIGREEQGEQQYEHRFNLEVD